MWEMPSYVKKGKTVNGKDFKNKRFKWKIGKEGSCGSKNIVYLLECEKEYCKKKYMGYHTIRIQR
jgi:hypothetical protein